MTPGSFCLRLGKHRVEVRLVSAIDSNIWEYRILDENGEIRKAGICETDETCRQRARAAAIQVLSKEFIAEELWALERWTAE